MNEEMIKEAMTPHLVSILSKFVSPISRPLQKSQTLKYLGTAKALYRKKGPEAALDFLAKAKDVTHNMDKIPSYFIEPKFTRKGSYVGKMVRTSIGNTADMAKTLTKGVKDSGWHAPIQVSKNLLSAMGKDLRSARYTTVSAENTMKEKAIKFFTKKDMPNYKDLNVGDKIRKKKIVGTRKVGDDVSYLVKRTPKMQTAALAMSAPAWGGYAYLGNKEKPKLKRAASAVGEAAAWTVAPTATLIGTTLADVLKHKNKTV